MYGWDGDTSGRQEVPQRTRGAPWDGDVPLPPRPLWGNLRQSSVLILHGEDVLLSHTHRCWGLGLGGDNGRAGVAWLGPPGWSRSSEQVPAHEPRPRRARSAGTRAGEDPDEVPMSFPSPLSTDFAASDGHARNHGKSKTPEITEPLSPRGRHESGVL